MTDRPILFSAPMVRALLASTKTQTRRILKPQPTLLSDGPGSYIGNDGKGHNLPYAVGDRLWVREAWRAREKYDRYPNKGPNPGSRIIFEADAPHEDGLDLGKLRPSIFMPRWASRLTLTVTDVRVQHLHDISEEDARAEGVEPPDQEREDRDNSICPTCGGTRLYVGLGANYGVSEFDCYDCDTHIKRYKHLWNHINGSWDANPWIVALTFDVRKGNIDG